MRKTILLLAKRESGSSGTGMLIAVAVIAALAAIATSRLVAIDPTGPPPRGGVLAITQFDVTSAIVLALLAAIRLTARPAEDHAAGWLHAFVGSGGSRREYVAALYLAVTGSVILAFTVSIVAFAAVVMIAGGGTGAVMRAPETWLVGSLLIASFAAYGMAAGLLIKEAGAALGVAIIAFALPFAISVSYVLSTDNSLPRWVRYTGFAHVPPLGMSVSPTLLVHHALFLVTVTLLAHAFAPRMVGRW